MPKQIYKIESFHGGLNSNADPRDISDTQMPDCNDISIDKIGRVTLMGKDSRTGNALDAGGSLPCVYNSGLFSYSHDYRLSDASEGIEFMYANYDGTDDIEVTGSDGDSESFSFSPSVSGIPPSYSLADGDLRVSDTGLTRDTIWFGHIKSDRWPTVDKLKLLSPGWTDSGASPKKPTVGNCIVSSVILGGTEVAGTVKTWDDTTGGMNSANNEIIGLVSDDLIDDAALNLRVGATHSTIIASVAADYTSVHGVKSDTSDIIPFIGNKLSPSTIVKVAPSSASDNASFSMVQKTSMIGVSIDDSNAVLIPIYIGSAVLNDSLNFDDIKSVDILIGDGTSSTGYNWVVDSSNLRADMWNLVLCSPDNFTSKGDSAPDLGESLTDIQIIVRQSGGVSSVTDNRPTFYIGGVTSVAYSVIEGFPQGHYTFHYTWLYDNSKQESLPFQLGDPSLTNGVSIPLTYKGEVNLANGPVQLNFQCYISKGNGSYTINKRITGARIYTQIDTSDEYYLIGEVDFIKEGFKFLADSDVIDYTFADAADSTGNLNDTGVSEIISPIGANGIDTFKTINGFSTNTNDITAKYKTATMQGRRMFIGNVKHDADGDGTEEAYGDRMLKSMVNKFDTYPSETSIVDVAIRDGESIVKLESYADRILQFKQKSLYIVNVSETVEFLEDVLRHKGVNNEYHVVKTDYGVAWFNQYGAYFYDGQSVINLLENNGIPIINIDTWQTFVGYKVVLTTVSEVVDTVETSVLVTSYSSLTSERYIQMDSEHMYITAAASSPITVVRGVQNSSKDSHSNSGDIYDSIHNSSIGYIPKTRQLIISNKDENVYIYDFTLKAWTKGTDRLTSSVLASTRTNFVLNQDDDLIYGGAESGDVMEYKWSSSPAISKNYIYLSRDIDFGQPAQRKKIYKVYISYKGDGSTVSAHWSKNGDNDTYTAFSSNSLANVGTDDWVLKTLSIVTPSDANNIYSFQIKIQDSGVGLPVDFEINDISIVFRLKPVK